MKTKSKRRKSRTPRILTGNHPSLKTVCKPVTDFEIATKVIRDLKYCLDKRKRGVGLSANQIGSDLRIILVQTKRASNYNVPGWPAEFTAMINPVITDASVTTNIATEGCLSYPGIYKSIKRSSRINVKYNTIDGSEHYVMFSNFEARIIQHEIDHLNGLCRISPDEKVN